MLFFAEFLISSWFNATDTAYWKHLLSFRLIDLLLLFCFYTIRRMYIWSASFKIYLMTFIIQWMTTTKNKITTSHWCVEWNMIAIKKWFKTFFSNLICFIINNDIYVITFWMHMLFIIIFRRNKLIAIANWIFHISDFLRLFMVSLKYGLILLSYSSTAGVLFLSPLLSYSINYYSKNYLFLLVDNNLLHAQRFLISLLILFLIALFLFLV